MSALAFAPAPAPAAPTTPGIEPPSIPFCGRSLAEYTRFFALDLTALKGRDVLDVAAGPSSFTAEACARKIDAVAVDPLYGAMPDVLATGGSDYARMARKCAGSGGVPRAEFRSLEAALLDRAAPPSGFSPTTPRPSSATVTSDRCPAAVFDGTFDLVLCAHLLFTSAPKFDFDWHVAACRELVRVSAEEVRLHPLVGPDGKPYPGLARLRRSCAPVASRMTSSGGRRLRAGRTPCWC